jgi:TetR/AcrR family transcriptional regulator, transcriptional repressor for nem operon
MAHTASDARAPGRPRAFDGDAVLDRAIEVFREHGYEASSMADIERATGLNTSSIYNAFGSKKALFEQSLHRYEAVRVAGIFDILGSGTDGLADLHRALEAQQAESVSEWGRGGCFAINTMIELGPRAGGTMEELAEFRRKLGEAIRLPLDRAVALGEIDAQIVPTAVALLVSFTLGVGVLMRGGAPDAELAVHFEAAHALVDSWKRQR